MICIPKTLHLACDLVFMKKEYKYNFSLFSNTSGFSSNDEEFRTNLSTMFNSSSTIHNDKQIVLLFGDKPLKGDSIYREAERFRDIGKIKLAI